MTIIKKLLATEKDKSVCGRIVEDIKAQRQYFRSIRFRYTPRSGNRVAHELA